MATFKQQTAKLKAGEVAYWSGGRKTLDAEGHEHLPVVYLHGSAGLAKAPAHELLAADRRLFMPIAPGLDGTEKLPGVDSMPALADLVADFIRKKLKGQNGVGKCDLWGHSFGGWLACWVAARHPDVVELLVLENPAGFRPPGKGGAPQGAAQMERMMIKHPEKALPDDRSPAMHAANQGVARHYHQGAPYDEALVAKLGHIAAPTLIVYATEEEIVPVESVELLRDRLPRRSLIYMYDARHMIQVDQPERLVRLVRDFFDRGEAFIVPTPKAAE